MTSISHLQPKDGHKSSVFGVSDTSSNTIGFELTQYRDSHCFGSSFMIALDLGLHASGRSESIKHWGP